MTVTTQYYYGLDRLRAILMLVGVFWHAVSVISPTFQFVYSSLYHKSLAIFAIVYPEHIFRMETFFLISGFLALMIFERKGRKAFFIARVKRVLIPLLLACYGVNLLLQIFGSIYMGFEWRNFDLWRWVMHGWFLITLFVCACLDMLLPRNIYQQKLWFILAILLVSAVLIYPSLLYLNGHYWHFFGSIDGNLFNFLLVNTVQFYPFYLLGGWLYANRQCLHTIPRSMLMVLALIGFLMAVLETLHGIQLINLISYFPSVLGGAIYHFIHLLSAASIAFLLFYYSYHLQSINHAWINYLIQSAIVIYLVHHPLVIIIAWLFDSPLLSSVAYYVLMTAVTLALSFAAYEMIRRVSWLRFAFGLSPVKK